MFNIFFEKFRHSKIRHILWPIRSYELFKFLPMVLLMFCILLNYNIVRGLKDSIIMTMVGPEVISYIKLCIEMPFGLLFVVIYTKLCNIMSTERVFRLIVTFFLLFFIIFAFLIFPAKEILHPDKQIIADYIMEFPRLKWFIIIWGNWSFVMFYVIAELWPVIIFAVLFWQLANKITKTEEASRFYTFFSLFGQGSLLISGAVMVYFTSADHVLYEFFKHLSDEVEITIKSLTALVAFFGVLALCIHYFIEKTLVLPSNNLKKLGAENVLKLGVKESMKLILASKYLWLICFIMIAYATCANLIEGLWFSKARELYPVQQDFMRYQGEVLFFTGLFTILCSIVGSSIIRHFGWLAAAIVTPIITLIIGAVFFLTAEFAEHFIIGNLSPLMITVFIGGLQNVLFKGSKYSLFDATKEMLYIPLTDEVKTKGKAAVDIIGIKIGRSFGALMQFSVFTIFPNYSYNDIIIFLLSLFVIICAGWIFSVIKLNKYYNQSLERIASQQF